MRIAANTRNRLVGRTLIIPVHSAIDAIRLGKDISHGILTDLLTGCAIASIGRSQITRSTIEKLNATEATAAAQRMEKLEARDISYAEVLREEKNFGNLMLRDTFREGDAFRKEYPTTKTTKQITTDYNRLMDEAILNVTLPFSLRKSKLSRADDKLTQTFTSLYTSGVATTGVFEARDKTLSQLLKTQLALRAFKAEHKSYPATLNELMPKYLSRVPLDPFSNH